MESTIVLGSTSYSIVSYYINMANVKFALVRTGGDSTIYVAEQANYVLCYKTLQLINQIIASVNSLKHTFPFCLHNPITIYLYHYMCMYTYV